MKTLIMTLLFVAACATQPATSTTQQNMLCDPCDPSDPVADYALKLAIQITNQYINAHGGSRGICNVTNGGTDSLAGCDIWRDGDVAAACAVIFTAGGRITYQGCQEGE